MARIIYKEGLEDQNRLECVEGVEIDLLNGQKAGAQSDPVGDDWMFGKMGSKGLFAKKR